MSTKSNMKQEIELDLHADDDNILRSISMRVPIGGMDSNYSKLEKIPEVLEDHVNELRNISKVIEGKNLPKSLQEADKPEKVVDENQLIIDDFILNMNEGLSNIPEEIIIKEPIYDDTPSHEMDTFEEKESFLKNVVGYGSDRLGDQFGKFADSFEDHTEGLITSDLLISTNEKIIGSLDNLLSETKGVITEIKNSNDFDKERFDVETQRMKVMGSEKREMYNENRFVKDSSGVNEETGLSEKFGHRFVTQSILSKLGGNILMSGMIGAAIGPMIPKILGKVSSIFGKFIPGFGNKSMEELDKSLNDKSRIKKYMPKNSKMMKALKIGGAVVAIGSAIYDISKDAISYAIKKEEWSTRKYSTIFGLIMGSSKRGIINSFSQAGKYGTLGAGIGFVAGGPPGALVGGIAGSVIGGLMGFFGGKRISRWIDRSIDELSRWSDRLLNTNFIFNESELIEKERSANYERDLLIKKLEKSDKMVTNYNKRMNDARLSGNRYLLKNLRKNFKNIKKENEELNIDLDHFNTQIKNIKSDIEEVNKGFLHKQVSFFKSIYDKSIIKFENYNKGGIPIYLPSINKKNLNVYIERNNKNFERNMKSLNEFRKMDQSNFFVKPRPNDILSRTSRIVKNKNDSKSNNLGSVVGANISNIDNSRRSSTIINSPPSSTNFDNSVSRLRNNNLGNSR